VPEPECYSRCWWRKKDVYKFDGKIWSQLSTENKLLLYKAILKSGLSVFELELWNLCDFKTDTSESLSTLLGTSPMTLYIMILMYHTLETRLKDSADRMEKYLHDQLHEKGRNNTSIKGGLPQDLCTWSYCNFIEHTPLGISNVLLLRNVTACNNP